MPRAVLFIVSVGLCWGVVAGLLQCWDKAGLETACELGAGSNLLAINGVWRAFDRWNGQT